MHFANIRELIFTNIRESLQNYRNLNMALSPPLSLYGRLYSVCGIVVFSILKWNHEIIIGKRWAVNAFQQRSKIMVFSRTKTYSFSHVFPLVSTNIVIMRRVNSTWFHTNVSSMLSSFFLTILFHKCVQSRADQKLKFGQVLKNIA